MKGFKGFIESVFGDNWSEKFSSSLKFSELLHDFYGLIAVRTMLDAGLYNDFKLSSRHSTPLMYNYKIALDKVVPELKSKLL